MNSPVTPPSSRHSTGFIASFTERFFQLSAHGTTVSREMVAGLTTFMAMAYILAVNPSVLSAAGMDKGALITATAVTAAVMTAVMALATNYPIAMAPGMGLNAFVAFTLCGAKGLTWQEALGLVFYSGLIFFLLTFSGLRQKIVEAIPRDLKLAITAGIGFFIAFIGMQKGGLVQANPATLVALGDMAKPEPWLALGGLWATAIFVLRRVPGAVVIPILAITLLGIFIPAQGGYLTAMPVSWVQIPFSLEPLWGKLDLGYFWHHLAFAIPLVLAILFVDLFDNMGTLIGVSHRAGLLDANGNLPKIGRAFAADAGAAMFGSVVGTSTVTSYIESAAGVEAGGRTGLSVLFTALCFLLALVFTPLLLVMPTVATAPALIVVGIFMMRGLAEIDLRDFAQAAPAFVTVLFMPLTFSMSEGIAFGLLTYVGTRIGMGRAKEVNVMTWVLSGLFIFHEIFSR